MKINTNKKNIINDSHKDELEIIEEKGEIENLNGKVLHNSEQNEYKFSFFKKPITNLLPTKELTLEEVYNLIISDEYKEVTSSGLALEIVSDFKEHKKHKYDYVTFNGTFTQRNDKSLIKASGLFIIDIDNLDDNLIVVKDRLITDKILSPQLIFISPSGKGIKVVVRIDTSLIELENNFKKMNFIWTGVNNYFSKEYNDLIKANENGDFIDGACKDLSRACFLCRDENAFLNINPKSLEKSFFTEYKANKALTGTNEDLWVSPTTTLDTLAKRHTFTADNHHGELIKFIGAAKSISTSEEDVFKYIDNNISIAQNSGDFDYKVLKETIRSIYRQYDTDTKGVKKLSSIEFTFVIFIFKFNKGLKDYVLDRLFMDGIRNELHTAGFSKRKISKNEFIFIQKRGIVIIEVTAEIMKDYFVRKIDKIDKNFSVSYQNKNYQIPYELAKEIFFKKSNEIFNDKWLQQLQINEDEILKDTEDEMYFFFKNAKVTVTKERILKEPINELENINYCIWEEQIIQHDFEYIDDYKTCYFYKFLKNVTNHDKDRWLTMISGIGYLLNHYFKESEGQAVILYDETITDLTTPMGGSGKGLIVSAIKQLRNVSKIDGKHLQSDNRFKWEQVTPSTQVVWLDDVKADFDFSILHSNLTDGWTIERKYKPQFIIEPINSPKTVICSNSIIKRDGSTNKRRQHIIELSDFYSSRIVRGDEKPIEEIHGCLFFSKTQWDANEWNMFYSLLFDAAFQYLNTGLVYNKGVNVEINSLKQATNSDFVSWVQEQEFELNEKYDTKKCYNQFVDMYYGTNYQIGQRTFTTFLNHYANYMGWKHSNKQSNGISYFSFSAKSI